MNLSAPTLRPTVPADTPALLAVTAATGMFQPYEVETLGEVLADYHTMGDGSGHAALTLEDGGPVGFVYFALDTMTDGTWDLWWIVVGKDRQGRGDGRRLLERVEREVAERGGRQLLIETSSTPPYEPTRRFYLRNGYHEVARIPHFYRAGDDKVIFAKAFVPYPA